MRHEETADFIATRGLSLRAQRQNVKPTTPSKCKSFLLVFDLGVREIRPLKVA